VSRLELVRQDLAVRVMLVDDAWLVRDGIARLLVDAGIDVAAQLADAANVLETAGQPAR
jgi:DNA-binding NarL/FixJ family response regulator